MTNEKMEQRLAAALEDVYKRQALRGLTAV